jgi:cysteinyl-tRNA synthetase
MTAPPPPPPVSLFNTLTRRVEPLQPLAPPRVTFYACGPTVWNYAHIGNFRTFLFEDLLRRWLEYAGYDVFQIMNLTDVDDRTIRAARQAGKPLVEHTAPFAKAFFEDRDYLRIKPAHVYTPATAYMPQMIALVSRLLERGVAYKGEDGSVYFSLAKFPTYGRLSRLDTREIRVGARVASDEYAKGDPSDFALWKKADAEDEAVGAAWDAPFGRGRPGWHLECSAMALEEIRKCCDVQTLDIHAGGIDLIFPHHENEIAQSEGATGQPFARHWVHGEFLNVRGTKMSKRHGNFLTARDLREQGVDAAAVRLLFFQTHYRQPVDFTDEALEAAKEGVRRLGEFYSRLQEQSGQGQPNATLTTLTKQLEEGVAAALNDDLNAPRAVAALFEFVRAVNRELDRPTGSKRTDDALAALDRLAGASLLDVLASTREVDAELVTWVTARLAARSQARKSKDFKAADAIRAELSARGVEIEDTPQGTKWKAR